jgi:hypothetical protein
MHLPELLDQIVNRRDAGETIAVCVERHFTRVEDAASEFGLVADADIYDEVSLEEAVAVLTSLMHKDMAYGVELVPIEQARELARSFINHFPADTTRYFTNGTYGKPSANKNFGASWTPATDATFDSGVLVLSSALTACVWCMDED